MARWFAAPAPLGNDANLGDSYANPKLTLNGLLSVGYAAGDELIAAPGVYRNTTGAGNGVVELNGSGAYITDAGTISVTEGSKIVTGTGTGWAASVQAGDRLVIPYFAYDRWSGVTPVGPPSLTIQGPGVGATDFEFQAGIVGFMVTVVDGSHGGVNGGAYLVAGVTSTDVITLTDVNGVGNVVADDYNMYIPTGEGSYEIASVDSDTQITLTRAWSGPDYTWTHDRYNGSVGVGHGYEIVRPVKLIGDETGQYTDGIGGVCRITGSTDDQSVAAIPRNGIYNGAAGGDYWVIKGFQIDSVYENGIEWREHEHLTVEDVRIMGCANNTGLTPPGDNNHVYIYGETDHVTIRRCAFFGGDQAWGVNFDAITAEEYVSYTVENVYAACYSPFRVDNVNNVVIKDCIGGMAYKWFLYAAQPLTPIGHGTFVHDCDVRYAETTGLEAAVLGDIVANWNNYWDNNADRVNVGVAGATNTILLYLPRLQSLVDGYRYPARLYPPGQWWGNAQYAGLYPANEDMYGVPRPTTRTKRSLGPYQDIHIERNATTTFGGYVASMEQEDARWTMFRCPISGAPVTVTARVYLQATYAGLAPRIIVHQAGGVDIEGVASGVVGAWEELSVSYEPGTQTRELWIAYVSDNTAAAGATVGVLWQLPEVVVDS